MTKKGEVSWDLLNKNFFKVNKIPFKPRKELGQNFIFDENFLKKISDFCFLDLEEKPKIVEIGPGYGSLTSFLEKRSKKVYCFEKDEKIFNLLKNHFFADSSKVQFFLADALEVDWEEFFNNHYNKEEQGYISLKSQEEKINLVGNLPYNISNKIIFNVIEQKNLFNKVVFLVQKEVAQRWTANPIFNKSQYSYLSIFLEYFSEKKLNFEISKEFFYPIPKVDACLVTLKIKKNFHFSCKKREISFLKFVKSCFRFRRKSLFNNIKSFIDSEKGKISKIFEVFNYDRNIRPQDLWMKDYFNLYEKIYSQAKCC